MIFFSFPSWNAAKQHNIIDISNETVGIAYVRPYMSNYMW